MVVKKREAVRGGFDREEGKKKRKEERGKKNSISRPSFSREGKKIEKFMRKE